MSKSTWFRFLAGVACILPIANAVIFNIISPSMDHDDAQGLFTFWSLYPGVWGGITVGLIVIGLVISLLLILRILAGKSEPSLRRKAVWILLLVFGNVFVLPIYWFMFLRKSGGVQVGGGS